MAPRFYKQQHSSTCGIAVFRTLLENNFNISKTENGLIRLAESMYRVKSSGLNNNYKIRINGTDVYHFVNLAKYFGLRVFTKSYGTIRDVKNLIKTGLWVVIHRPFELDGDGHYLLVLGYNDKYIYLFDPNKSNGGIKKENYSKFYKKWSFSQNNERWLMCFYPKGEFKINTKGKHL